MAEAEADRKKEQDALGIDYQIKGKDRGGRKTPFTAAFGESRTFKPAIPASGQLCTEFSVEGKPLEIIAMLHDLIIELDPNVKISKSSWRLTFEGALQTPIDDFEENEQNGELEESKEEKQELQQEFATALIQVELH